MKNQKIPSENYKKSSNKLKFKEKNYFNKTKKNKNIKIKNPNSNIKDSKKVNNNILNKFNSKKEFLVSRYKKFFGENETKNLLTFENKLKNNQFIRINLSKTTIEEVEKFLTKNRVKFSKTFIKNALKIEKSFFNISSSILSINGSIYIQDLASQIPVNLIDFDKLKTQFKNKTIKILDMAASPGSKTTQIADLCKFYNIDFQITALEPDEKRLNRLINNLNKQEIENVTIFNVKGEEFKTNEKFDLILLDAPCSGNFIDDNNWFSKRDIMGIENNSKIQRNILKNAKQLLTENGQLIYSTCSIEPEEDEYNIKWCEDNLKLKTIKSNFKFGFKTSPINNYKNQNSIRIMPNHSKTQGFFACILKNNYLLLY